jgi:uncharacterized repeat protein (TIGR01451 family)
LAPADAVTLTLTGTSSQTSSFAPTIAASYTPQAIGTLQTSAPLAFTIIVPPAAAELNASASHVDPLTVGVPANLTDAYLNIGTAPTSGQLEAHFWPSNLTYNGYVGSDPSWTCTNQGSYVDCLSNAVVQPNGSLPLVFQVTPTGNPAYNELDVFGGNAVNANADILYVDPINVNNTPIVSLAITSINDNGGTFYTNVQGAYTITLTNQGALASSGAITLTDTLPANFAYNSFSGAGWACVGPAPTITCTYAGSIAAATSAPVTINVTPALALQDTNVSSSISGSGGGASPFGPNTTNEAVVGPIQFVSQSLGSNALLGATTGFAPTSGDQATLDIGYPPGGAGLAGNMSIVALDGFAGHYGIGSDNCTGPVMDTTFSTALGSTSANGASVVNFGINVIAATQAGPCSIQITDTNGNVANLSIQVESSGFTIQSRARKPITGASHR